jgi:hypothetical protein
MDDQLPSCGQLAPYMGPSPKFWRWYNMDPNTSFEKMDKTPPKIIGLPYFRTGTEPGWIDYFQYMTGRNGDEKLPYYHSTSSEGWIHKA